MKRILIFLGFSAALAYAACAHYPEGNDPPPSDGGNACGTCPDGQTCVDGTCMTPPDGGNGGSDGGTCTGSSCPTDGGNGSGSDGGSGGGSDGGSGGGHDGGMTCGCDHDCGCGETCEQHVCVKTGCCTDNDCPDGKACRDGDCVCDGDDSNGSCRPGKTLLCHYPPGNPANRHDICVGDPAVPAHLAHGDTLGACP